MKEAEFILFMDPETEEFFSYCEEKGILVKEYPLERFRDHIKTDLKTVKALREDKYRGEKEISEFQRRPPPTDFLAFRKFRYPIYSTQGILHDCMLEYYGFSQEGVLTKPNYKDSIKARVYYGSIHKQLKDALGKHPDKNLPYIDPPIDIKIITSANQMIRTVCRSILQDHKIVISTTKSNQRLIFKRLNHEEYLYGNQAIGNYNCVRQCLRQDKTLEVEIIQSQVNQQKEQFQKFVFYRHIDSIDQGYYEPYDWNKLLLKDHCGFFMWHRPKNCILVNPEQLRDLEDNAVEKQKYNSKIKARLQQIKKEKKLPRFLIKDTIKIMVDKRRGEIEKKIVYLDGSTIYSGECEYFFSFQILGITSFSTLLKKHHSTEWQTKASRRPFPKLLPHKEQAEDNIINLSTAQKRYNHFSMIKKQSNIPIIPYLVSVQIQYYYNGQPNALKGYETPVTLITNENTPLNQKVNCGWCLSQIMLETSLVVKVRIHSKEGQSVICGVGVLKLFDEWGYLKQGHQRIQLLSQEDVCPVKLGCHHQILNEGEKDRSLPQMVIALPKYNHPVRWTLSDPQSLKLLGFLPKDDENDQMNVEDKMDEVMQLLKYDPIRMLAYTREEKAILRVCKKFYKHQSDKLINYLYAIDWKDCKQVWKAYEALDEWAPLKPIEALFLLTPRLSDEKVRYFAVKILAKMSTNDFCLYSNQITQALVSFETHDNPLLDLIIQRSSAEPYVIGYEYFWQFKNRVSQYITDYRFTLYFQTLVLTSPIRLDFYKQVQVNNLLIDLNVELKKKTDIYKNYEQKADKFPPLLPSLEKKFKELDPSGFSFPIRPEKKFKHILPSFSRMFDSKKLPFSLACTYTKVDEEVLKKIKQKSAKEYEKKVQQKKESPMKGDSEKKKQSGKQTDTGKRKQQKILNKKAKDKSEINEVQEKPYCVMFKCGDDIKQDHLILQIFTVFNNLWVSAGLNLRLNIYRVLSTGNQMGFIQIVDNAENSSKIHKDYSGKIVEAFDDQATLNYLRSKNPDEDDFRVARQNYIRSNAAYLVATYVLGIGDRHSGNYMVQSNGKFFHIDFGHILGDFKTKFNIKRERTPFVFTTENAYVMGGEKSKDFARFQLYCKDAYNILRKNSKTIIHLMSMMVGADIPQLKNFKNLEYLIDKLHLEMSDYQASEHLIKEIKKTLENQTRKYDNFFHEKMRNG